MQSHLPTNHSSGLLDKTGAAVSWACAAHCLAAPLLVSFLPLFGLGFLAREETEYLFIGLSILLAAASLLPAFFRVHRNFKTLLFFAGGLGLIISADSLFDENSAGKLIFVICGAGFMTAAHLLNRYLCGKCRACAETVCHS